MTDRKPKIPFESAVMAEVLEEVKDLRLTLSLEETQHYVGRQMEHEMNELQLADDENVARQVELGEERQVRDLAVAKLYGLTLVAVRVVEITHGPEARQKLLGPDGEVPTDPVRLQQTAARCQRWLAERSTDRSFFLFLNIMDAHSPYEVRAANPHLPAGVTARPGVRCPWT